MQASDYIISALASRMYSEPKDDLILGFTACGLIIRNRFLAGWGGGNWLTLVAEHDKYSAKSEVLPLTFGDPHHDPIFRRCLAIAENIYHGRERDITEGALWYGKLHDCSDDFKNKIVRQPESHPRVATVGQLACFR